LRWRITDLLHSKVGETMEGMALNGGSGDSTTVKKKRGKVQRAKGATLRKLAGIVEKKKKDFLTSTFVAEQTPFKKKASY